MVWQTQQGLELQLRQYVLAATTSLVRTDFVGMLLLDGSAGRARRSDTKLVASMVMRENVTVGSTLIAIKDVMGTLALNGNKAELFVDGKRFILVGADLGFITAREYYGTTTVFGPVTAINVTTPGSTVMPSSTTLQASIRVKNGGLGAEEEAIIIIISVVIFVIFCIVVVGLCVLKCNQPDYQEGVYANATYAGGHYYPGSLAPSAFDENSAVIMGSNTLKKGMPGINRNQQQGSSYYPKGSITGEYQNLDSVEAVPDIDKVLTPEEMDRLVQLINGWESGETGTSPNHYRDTFPNPPSEHGGIEMEIEDVAPGSTVHFV